MRNPNWQTSAEKSRAFRAREYAKRGDMARAHKPLYDPNRDGVKYHTSLTAYLMGDPLPGRSGLDQRKEVCYEEVS